MEAFRIVVKALLLSVFVIYCFQIKWEGQTLEEKTLEQIESSGFSEFIHDTARGGVAAAKDFYEIIMARWSEYESSERASR